MSCMSGEYPKSQRKLSSIEQKKMITKYMNMTKYLKKRLRIRLNIG
ncbi:hypothetical protein ACEN9X_00750 [Mucilaginibacter sp. Mucisp86]